MSEWCMMTQHQLPTVSPLMVHMENTSDCNVQMHHYLFFYCRIKIMCQLHFATTHQVCSGQLAVT